MDLEMSLNEISFKRPTDHRYEARARIARLVETVRMATRHGVQRSVGTHSSLWGEVLASGYNFGNWYNDNEVDRDVRQFLATLVSKGRVLDDLYNDFKDDRLVEVKYDNQPAYGLGAAFIYDGMAVSLDLADWQDKQVQAEHSWMDDETTVLSEIISVFHASTPDHVTGHREWIRERIASSVLGGEDLWDRRNELLPHVDLCEAVRSQLRVLGKREPHWIQTRKRLFELNTYCMNWQEGPFQADQLPCRVTPDSKATLEQYSKERRVMCPDGQYRIFSWHARITPGRWRLYFEPNVQARKVFVGYVGDKLPTVDTPT